MKIKCLLLVGLFYGLTANAQINKLELSAPAIVSPDAASLGKYGEMPVNLSTGIPSISIPVYEIKDGLITIPITFNYHAGGIKVDEVASWVGLGWSLNAGGVISRVQRGLPDNNDPSYSGIGFKNYGYKASQFYSMSQSDKAKYLYSIETDAGDGEPDIFYYNFGNYSGKFFFKNNGQIATAPNADLKITYIESPRGWQIITPDGTTYLFNEAETTNSEIVGNTYPSQLEPETAWYLKSIKDINNHIVQFQYEDVTTGFETIGDESVALQMVNGQINYIPNSLNQPRVYNTINGKVLSKILFTNGEINFVLTGQARLDDGNASLSKITIKNAAEVIKEITLNTSYFSSGANRHEKRLKLESIVEKIPSTSTEGAKYIFQYDETLMPSRLSSAVDHWGFYNYNGGPSRIGFDFDGGHYGSNKEPFFNYAKAGILNKITYPAGGTTEFEYEGNQTTTTIAQHYGNPTTLTGLEGDNFDATQNVLDFQQAFTISTTDLSPLDGLAHIKIYNGEYIGPNPFDYNYYVSYTIYNQNNTIIYSDYNGTNNPGGQSLTLPVGTYTLKVQIDNDQTAEPEISFSIGLLLEHLIPATTVNKNVGGIRIKKITSSALSGAIPEIKNYKYNKFGQTVTSGTTGQNPVYSDFRNFLGYVLGEDQDGNLTCQQVNYSGLLVSSSSYYPLSNTQGAPVVYENVTFELGNNAENGKVESTFTSYNGHGDISISQFPFPPAATFEHERGHLLKETKYKKTSSGFDKVEEIEHTYNAYNYLPEEILGFKLGREIYDNQYCQFYVGTLGNGGSDLETTAGINKYLASLEWAEYSTVKAFLYLQSTKKRIYDSNNPSVFAETTTNYTYGNSHFQPTTITMTNSKGEGQKIENKYPHEMQSTGSPNVYNEMVTRNIISPIVEQAKYKNTSDFIQSAKTTYDFWNNGTWGTNNSTSLIVPRTLEQKLLGNSQTVMGRYTYYDMKGNPVTLSNENDAKTTYLWGYNKTCVVAKIVGVDYSQVSSLFNQSVLDNPASDLQLKSELNSLRTALAGMAALVTTYTYKPLVGMVSQTNASGQTVFYEYDAFNRLSVVRDANNNVLKKYCYNFYGQQEDCSH